MTQEWNPSNSVGRDNGNFGTQEPKSDIQREIPIMSPIPGGKHVGTVTEGSATRGVQVRLEGSTSTEDIKVGTFVTIQGQSLRFFGVVTDVTLATTNVDLKHNPPGTDDLFTAQVMSGVTAYGTVSVLPTLSIQSVLGHAAALSPAKTVPTHFSKAYIASDQDIETVFGTEDGDHFWIGTPLDMETKVCLNLKELVKRSNGVFGKSGTGKTFLTRLLLIGMLQGDLASSLIFDMHNEYGHLGNKEGGGSVKGLKQLFPSKVALFTLDPDSSKRRNSSPDAEVKIGYSEIEPEDILVLRETLNLSEIAAEIPYSLRHKWGNQWVSEFLELSGMDKLSELAQQINVNPSALSALHRRLQRIQRYPFMVPNEGNDPVKRILENLDRGTHVVLEFGEHGENIDAYMLVTNILTRRIHERYVRRKEQSIAKGEPEPRPLVIAIEEAHKFLSPAVAQQTIFGRIAREMRKYNVTLLVIDQRPSGIDTEVMSQVGTKVTCLLDNERDIDAVLTGVPGSREMRAILARLESQQQALILGHAVPMPVVVHTREYGSAESYKQLGQTRRNKRQLATIQPDRSLDEELKDLF